MLRDRSRRHGMNGKGILAQTTMIRLEEKTSFEES